VTLDGQRIVITGAAGFIGSELVRQISAAGGSVIAIDNLVNGRRENLEGLPAELVRLEVADIRDRDRIRTLLNGADIVFHLACLGVRHSIHSPHQNHDVNATGTLGLLTVARSLNIPRFVYVSSSEVYGTARWTPMSELHPAFPATVYGASKLAGECYARAFHQTYGYPTVVIRPFNTYGPRCHHEGDSGEVIPKFLLRSMARKPMVIFGDGTQTRDFTYVGDTARGILKAGYCDSAVGETVNLGQGAETSINALAVEISRLVGGESAEVVHEQSRPGDVLRLCADTSKAAALLQYTASVPLAEGLVRLRDWYLESGCDIEDLLQQERIRNWESLGVAN
jgi:UDP-glucose 4-epimerase